MVAGWVRQAVPVFQGKSKKTVLPRGGQNSLACKLPCLQRASNPSPRLSSVRAGDVSQEVPVLLDDLVCTVLRQFTFSSNVDGRAT